MDKEFESDLKEGSHFQIEIFSRLCQQSLPNPTTNFGQVSGRTC
jgi:hypothetical protein